MLSKASVVIPSARQKKMEVQRAERRADTNSNRDEVKLTASTENNDLVYLYTTHTVGYLVHLKFQEQFVKLQEQFIRFQEQFIQLQELLSQMHKLYVLSQHQGQFSYQEE